MKQDFYKNSMFKKWLIPKIIGASIIVMIIIITIIIVNMQERSQIYLEGAAKAIPLLRNEKMKMLGDLYIKLNNDFEQEIKNYELSYANRTNKRGDKIYYGVNGKENIDEMINDDYVNGIASVKYVKGSASNRPDGDSNFVDMVSFMTESLGVDIDKYDDEQLKSLFIDLFKLTHTFSGTSTELYPCDHGCAWCKYYCGDYMVQGTYGGETVGYFECDEFMGQSGEYGLMYDPFLISKETNYEMLVNIENNQSDMVTTTQSKHTNPIEHKRVVCDGGKSSTELFEIAEIEGICEVCSGGKSTFTKTTRKFAGCEQTFNCYHADDYVVKRSEDGETYVVYTCPHGISNSIPTNCSDYNDDNPWCSHIHSETCQNGDDGCKHDNETGMGCAGYYGCNGHEHYACPGHIIVCCFGHTNLNLEVKIMYHQEMIETIYNLIN